ncbi:MAG: sn-glycerol-3-phosphate ABC transporter ATP-binding protein UgpC [Coriobacteriales bacterium]|nr:sn-glycerol-3-phosphate ABC transporter ATP-binding protein UgpC [Coriobacteriales bacterium]
MASIQLKNISKVYPGDVTAVYNCDLEIADKEFLVLVGPSGCGKSTLLRMIAGLEELTTGKVYIGDRLVNDVPPKDRNIAMVFQSYALYPHMTVYKNMAFSLKLRKMPKEQIDEKVREAARILDIEHLLNRKPKALSGGQRQRVALGRAMVRNPAVFLLDEPLSNLDAKLRTSMRTEISKLHKQLETTFIYVTHDQTEAMTMGDRIVVIKDGVIQQHDTPQNLYEHPINKFVAGFIGSPQMNFVEVTLKDIEGKTYAVFGESALFIPGCVMSREAKDQYLNTEVVLGIRPECIDDDPARSGEYSTIVGAVELAESMGAEKYIYFVSEGVSFIARVSGGSKISGGDTAAFAIDCSRIKLFDKETELVISC